MDRTDNDRRIELLSYLTVAVAGFILVFTLFSLTALAFIAVGARKTSSDVKAVSIQNHNALCAFESNLLKDRNSSALYLAQHPQGLVGGLGEVLIPPDIIRQGIKKDNITIDALSQSLICTP